MVLYDCVLPGQRVEVRWNDGIFKGTVKYKGPIATKKGEWVGVALDCCVGDTAGMLYGRRYFQCKPNHGVFVRSDRLRFIPNVRCLFDRYHKVAESSGDEELFNSTRLGVKADPLNPVPVSAAELERFKSGLGSNGTVPMWQKAKTYNLRHSVSNCIPAATFLKAKTPAKHFRYLSHPIDINFWVADEFEKKPSIPKTHMPLPALQEQVKRGWSGVHYVRQMTVPTGRDKMKFSQWNDISA